MSQGHNSDRSKNKYSAITNNIDNDDEYQLHESLVSNILSTNSHNKQTNSISSHITPSNTSNNLFGASYEDLLKSANKTISKQRLSNLLTKLDSNHKTNKNNSDKKVSSAKKLHENPLHGFSDWGENRKQNTDHDGDRIMRFEWTEREIEILRDIYLQQSNEGVVRTASHMDALRTISKNPDFRKEFHPNHVDDSTKLSHGYKKAFPDEILKFNSEPRTKLKEKTSSTRKKRNTSLSKALHSSESEISESNNGRLAIDSDKEINIFSSSEEESETETKFSVGDRVVKQFEGSQWYEGEVVSIIRYDANNYFK